MGRTLENKQQIVEELKGLLGEAEMALVLDYKGLTIKEMSDLRTRLQAANGVCKVTKNTLMRRAIDGNSAWSELESLLTGTNAFILVKGDVGGAVKAVQSFQKDSKKSETRGDRVVGGVRADAAHPHLAVVVHGVRRGAGRVRHHQPLSRFSAASPGATGVLPA